MKTYTVNGVTGTLKQLAQVYGRELAEVRARCRQGETLAQALQPVPPVKRYKVGGESLTLPEWAARKHIALALLEYRLRRGWHPQRAIMTPPRATDLTGQQYGALTIRGPLPPTPEQRQRHHRLWECEGPCGHRWPLRTQAWVERWGLACPHCPPEAQIVRPRRLIKRVGTRYPLGTETLTCAELAQRAGCSAAAIRSRLQRGLTPEQAVAQGAPAPRPRAVGLINPTAHSPQEWALILRLTRAQVDELLATGQLEAHVLQAAKR